jgi:hypothetical protein
MIYLFFTLILILLSFTEVLVYNEEVLLALCFIAFIFFAYSTIGVGFTSDFQLQTEKLGLELMNALDLKALACFHLFKESTKLLELKYDYSLFQSLVPELFASYCKTSKSIARESISNDVIYCLVEIQKSIDLVISKMNKDFSD